MSTSNNSLVTVSSLEEIYKLVDPATTQVTLQDILNRRISIKGLGYETIGVDAGFKSSLCTQIAERLGGRGNTQKEVKAVLMRQNAPQHWGLDRFVIERYDSVKDGKPYITYIAGQDATYEHAQIRNFLKKQY